MKQKRKQGKNESENEKERSTYCQHYSEAPFIAVCQNPRNLSLCSVYHCEKKMKYFLVWNLNWNWD